MNDIHNKHIKTKGNDSKKDRIWELMTMDKWTITYKADDVREEDARLKFSTAGSVYKY